MRKSRYTTIPTPTWPCPYCGYVHYAVDLVRLDNERLGVLPVRPGVHGGGSWQSVDWVQRFLAQAACSLPAFALRVLG
jgi:hypothetical protein